MSSKYPFSHRQSWPVHPALREKRAGVGTVICVAAGILMVMAATLSILLMLGCSTQTDIETRKDEPAVPCEIVAVPLALVPPPAPVLVIAPPPLKSWEGKAPLWVIKGLLRKETRSTLMGDKSVRYVDKRRGAAGERGPTQLKRIAFDDVKRPGEEYWRVEVDTEFALEVTVRYLTMLRKQTGTWEGAIRAYNVGPSNWREAGGSYYRDVKRLGNEA